MAGSAAGKAREQGVVFTLSELEEAASHVGPREVEVERQRPSPRSVSPVGSRSQQSLDLPPGLVRFDEEAPKR